MAFNPTYIATNHLLRLLENISSLRQKIEMSTISVAWIPRLTKEAFSKMTHSSTAIEGNPLTLMEVQVLADGGTLPHTKPKHVNEILNYFAALRHISSNANKKNISNNDILKLHSLIGKNALDRGPVGKYRNYQVYVGNHIPPKANDIPHLINDLLEWLNNKGQALPAIFASAILHYQFEFIHPFGDGNGRVGRILATWEMFRRKFDKHHIFSVDEFFWENRQMYYSALNNVQRQRGNLTGWIEFVGEAVESALERAWDRIYSIRLSSGDRKLALTPKQEKLLRTLRTNPMEIKKIQSELKVTKQGAHFILKPLLENNLVKRIGGHKTGRYIIVS